MAAAVVEDVTPHRRVRLGRTEALVGEHVDERRVLLIELSAALVAQIRAKREAGESLAQIARELNALGTPTAHGGARWWPSTVRAVLDRVTDGVA